jgi:glycosyltransferase involved in cell wall biosynthesis
MKQADILISPRIKGENTPMKIYSYLDSGVPVIATDLPTHTQVMSTDISYLVKPEPAALSRGIVDLIENPELCKELSGKAREYIKKEHSYAVFKKTLYNIYDKLNE